MVSDPAQNHVLYSPHELAGLVKVLVTQPYLPGYRVPLFECLAQLVEESGGSLKVCSSQPQGELARRQDISDARWAHAVRQRRLKTPWGEFYWRRIDRDCDLLVTELDAGNLNAWWAAIAHRRRTVLWGHGDNYVNVGNFVARRIEVILARRVAKVMTYTQLGRRSLIRDGVPAAHVVTIGNATDTASLRRAYSTLSEEEIGSYRLENGVVGRRAFCFIGALDVSKRIDFLLRVAASAYAQDQSFLLLVAGEGALAGMVNGKEPYIRRVAGRTDREKALICTVSEACVVPGRVGLIAVDMQALGVPLLTTEFAFHAPELELVAEGRDYYLLPNDPLKFATEMLRRRDRSRSLPHDFLSLNSVAHDMFAVVRSVTG